MIAEFRLYNSRSLRTNAIADEIKISVSDSSSLRAIDGVLDMLKVHRDKMAASKPKLENLNGDEDEDEDEEG